MRFGPLIVAITGAALILLEVRRLEEGGCRSSGLSLAYLRRRWGSSATCCGSRGRPSHRM